MLNLSYLLIPKEYSLFENLFAYDKSKESINKENKDINVNIIRNKLSEKIGKSNINISNMKKSQKKIVIKIGRIN